MPIVLRHQAAGIAPDQENPRTKYGMAMVLQQQRSDQQMRQRTQDQQYDMQRMGAMGAMREMREPSRAERREMLDMQIQNGAVPQGLIKPLRDLAAEEARVMRNRSLNAEQMGEALSQIDSQMSIIMSSAYPQRMAANRMQQAQANQQPAGPPSAREAFRKDRKLFGEYTARAQATFEGAETPPTSQMILDKAGELFDAEQAWLNASPAAAPTQGQPASQPPNAPAAAPAGQPQASYSGGKPTFGGSPVMAQGGFGSPQPQGQVPPQSDPRFSHTQIQPGFRFPGQGPENPKGVKMVLGSMPPQYVLNDGTQVESKWENGQWVPDTDQTGPRSMMLNGGQRQPNAQGGIQQNSMRLVGEPGIPNLIAGLGGPSDYQPQFNAQGGMGAPVGPGAYQPGGYTSPEVFGAANVLANPANQQYAEVSGGNRDTQYALQNPQMSAGQAYFDRNNPVRQEMSAADQSIVNPQKETLGKPGGRYGLGMIDYGINPATGNRVTASIRPGGTMPEYDEPVGPPGTAMGGRKGSLNIMGGKKKPATAAVAEIAEVSPGGTPVKDEPKTNQALAIPPTPNAASYQYQSPLAQAASVAMNAPQPSASAVPASKYGRSASTSALGREVEAAMQVGDELAAKEQQQAVEIATSPSPEPMTDAERKRLGLPTLKEMEEMRKNLDRNKTMGGIGLGGTGRAAGSYEPIKADKLPKDKGASATAQQKKASPQQTGMSQSLTDFASKQRPDVQNAIKEAYNPKLSERARENAIRFLLTQGIDLSEIL